MQNKIIVSVNNLSVAFGRSLDTVGHSLVNKKIKFVKMKFGNFFLIKTFC